MVVLFFIGIALTAVKYRVPSECKCGALSPSVTGTHLCKLALHCFPSIPELYFVDWIFSMLLKVLLFYGCDNKGKVIVKVLVTEIISCGFRLI